MIILIVILLLFTVFINIYYTNNVKAKNNNKNNNNKIVEVNTIATNSYVEKTLVNKFAFVGDIIISDRIINGYKKGGVDSILDKDYKKLFDECDVVAGNLECVITDREDAIPDKQFHFKVSATYSNCFKELGFNLLSLANNHILDYGQEGLMDTVNELDKLEIGHIGAGKNIKDASAPKLLDLGGRTYAVFSISLVVPNSTWKAKNGHIGINTGFDVDRICKNIKEYRNIVDKIFVIAHWGKELEESSNDFQKKIAYYLVNAGADMVVGAHSHTIQDIEYYKGVPIIYSLGNFIYGRTLRDTMVLEAEVDYSEEKKGKLKIRMVPGVANYLKTHKSSNPAEVNEKLKQLEAKSLNIKIDKNGYVEEVPLSTKSDITIASEQTMHQVKLPDLTNATISQIIVGSE